MLVIAVNAAALNKDHDTAANRQRRSTLTKVDNVTKITAALSRNREYNKLKATLAKFLLGKGEAAVYPETVIKCLDMLKKIVNNVAGGVDMVPLEYMADIEG